MSKKLWGRSKLFKIICFIELLNNSFLVTKINVSNNFPTEFYINFTFTQYPIDVVGDGLSRTNNGLEGWHNGFQKQVGGHHVSI